MEKENKTVFRRILKAAAWVLGILLVLLVGTITVAVSYLTPERLTPIVEREANRLLSADVSIGRVEISFYSTFPRFVLDVDSVTVRSKALDKLPKEVRDSLPSYADSLLSLDGLHASVNIPRLLSGTIKLYDVALRRPQVNIVQATRDVSNLDIFPPSEQKSDTAALSLPDFSFEHFAIAPSLEARYLSLPDSIDLQATLRAVELSGGDAPVYAIDLGGSAAGYLPALDIPSTHLGLEGTVDWDHRYPLDLELRDFTLHAGDIPVSFSTRLKFSEPLQVTTFDFRMTDIALSSVIDAIPAELRGELEKVDANLLLTINAALTAVYRPAENIIPSLRAVIEIPEGSASYDGMKLDKFSLHAAADIDGDRLDNSSLTIYRLFAQGLGMGFVTDATLLYPLSDPEVTGSFKGGLSFARLPKKLLSMVPGTVKGLLKADCKFELRRSWLTREQFHRIRATGSATLTDLDVNVPAFPIEAYSRRMELKFGTSDSYTGGRQAVDSLLTASLRVDTLACILPGMELHASDLSVGAGARNNASTSDTTQITPIGARLTAGRLNFVSQTDSLRVRLRKASAGLSLSRYRGQSRLPRLHADITAGRAFYADRVTRAMLTEATASVTVHPSMSESNTRRLARMDSLRRLYPGLSRDSLETLSRAGRSRRHTSVNDNDEAGGMDLEVDRSIRRLLRRWEARGRLSAARATCYTPLFPLRTRVTDLDMAFTTDSVSLRDTRVRAGHSDFRLNGSVANITKALTSRNASEPLRLNFNLTSDTINVNELAGAVFAGAAYSESHPEGEVAIVAADDDESIGPDTDLPTDSAAVLVIPSNIEATLNVDAANIIYSDLVFRRFHGVVNTYDGALNLSELSARSDVGSIGLNALYQAATRKDATFAFGLRIKDFRIKEFLDLIPAVDSLMPLLQGISGVINADLAATTALDSAMNLDLPSLKAALRISGDSLVVIDDKTYRTIGKWLLFKDKQRNMIDSMNVEAIIDNQQLQMFPFVFNLDRYRLGVSGHNDLAMNFKYHIAVLKSPLPFKFGINLSGTPDNMKVRLGRAKFSEKSVAQTVSIADTTRVNLVNEIRNVFRRGVNKARMRQLDFSGVSADIVSSAEASGDTISHTDSLYFIQQGIIAPPPAPSNL